MIKVSFIIIAYNEERTIKRCLDAIITQHNLKDYEIIVVNDGSKDRTGQVVEDYAREKEKIRLINLKVNQGRGAARKIGVQAAQGDYIAFIDADVAVPPCWLETCFGYMKNYDAVGGIAVPDGDVNYIYTLCNLKPKIVNPTTVVSGSNGLYKKEVFKNITFDQDLHDGEDSAFNKEMAKNGFRMLLIPSLTVDHKEARNFRESIKWLYQTGKGATRQLRQFGNVRLPDIAYFGLIVSIFFALIAYGNSKSSFFLAIPLFLVLLIDIIYIQKKFFFEMQFWWKYLCGIFVFGILLISYFIGRTAGWFVAVPQTKLKAKEVMICFDLEGKWGMPFEAEYDLEKSVKAILETLKKRKTKAIFFAVGKMIEENPEVIKLIHEDGHTIALHGYSHEHLNKIDKEKLQEFATKISDVNRIVKEIIGQSLAGFRSPYLMAPAFSSPELYKILSSQNYKWVSNREIRYPEELFRPDRIRLKHFGSGGSLFSRIFLVILNLGLILKEDITGTKGLAKIPTNIRWLTGGASAFQRHGLIEVPVYAPLDCDLLPLPKPEENTKENFIEYAIAVLSGGINREGNLYAITFHDWIIGTGNRLQILEKTLDALSSKNHVTFISSPMEKI